ncbi:hypothetical protein CBR_g52325 [Chara braunii]|uniref:Importin subunit alpha n=1 Tax=Chara braunii TaxID=69332 RepID=A0A388K6S0_CHABU|nr:hypothetical protein CBR_g52325 [Chara braunii]|eukprot:GBG65731.1 hypothetical protein CBR_g52325 [Chara braunii]
MADLSFGGEGSFTGGEGSWGPGRTPQRRAPLLASVGPIAAARRRNQAAIIGKERREALMRAKRICRGIVKDEEGVEDVVEMGDKGEGVEIDEEEAERLAGETVVQAVEELRALVKGAAPSGAAAGVPTIGKVTGGGGDTARLRVQALQKLRVQLSSGSFPPVTPAVRAGVIPLLIECLKFGSREEQLVEAAWCVTNIASGDSENTVAALAAAPLLIAHLGDKSPMPVAEQCAWALGNMAGEGPEVRAVLLANGALRPLARLMGVMRPSSVARTSAWVMSNLIKGPDPSAAMELMKVRGMMELLISALSKGDTDLVVEVAWVLTYVTSMLDPQVPRLIEAGLLPPLLRHLVSASTPGLLTPVVRTIGNIVAGENSRTDAVLVAGAEIPGGLIGGLVRCLESEHRILQKEAAWVLSNIAGGTVAHKEAVFSGGAMPPLLHLLATAAFDVRKEVAYVIGNVCVMPAAAAAAAAAVATKVGHSPSAGEVEEMAMAAAAAHNPSQPDVLVNHLVSVVDRGCVPGFIALVRSLDIEAAKLGLQFLELVLRAMPDRRGPQVVEKEDGIEAMESLQNHSNDELRAMSNHLIDKFFGEDYGLEEEYGVGAVVGGGGGFGNIEKGDDIMGGGGYPPWRTGGRSTSNERGVDPMGGGMDMMRT